MLGTSPAAVQAAQATTDAEKAAPATNTADSTAAPAFVIVGHGPDRPNGQVAQDFSPATIAVVAVPVFVPYLVIVPTVAIGDCVVASPTAPSNVSASPGPFGRFMSDPMARFTTNATAPVFAACPPIAPRALRHRDR
jgi:hypothetical protein